MSQGDSVRQTTIDKAEVIIAAAPPAPRRKLDLLAQKGCTVLSVPCLEDQVDMAALMRENWGRDHVRATSEADYASPPPGEGELSETQVDAILNMRLRSLRRLEELELVRERDDLMIERAEIEDLLDSLPVCPTSSRRPMNGDTNVAPAFAANRA